MKRKFTKKVLLIFILLSVFLVLNSFKSDSDIPSKNLGLYHSLASGFSYPKKNDVQTEYLEDEILIKYKNTMSTHLSASSVSSSYSLKQFGRPHYGEGLIRTKITDNKSVEEKINELNRDPNIEFAQPNFIYQPLSVTPNDPSFSQQWGLKNTGQLITDSVYTPGNPGNMGNDINAENAWDITTDCSNIIVAVLDTGINYKHEDLKPNMTEEHQSFNGIDTTETTTFSFDISNHGTQVAGIIASAANDLGGVGVCHTAKIISARVLGESGGTTSSITSGIESAIDKGAKIINMSFGGYSYDEALKAAIEAGIAKGVLFVVAAGNSAENQADNPKYPCAYELDNIICVTALDQAYNLADFSDWGATQVDIGAPGVNIHSPFSHTPMIKNFGYDSSFDAISDPDSTFDIIPAAIYTEKVFSDIPSTLFPAVAEPNEFPKLDSFSPYTSSNAIIYPEEENLLTLAPFPVTEHKFTFVAKFDTTPDHILASVVMASDIESDCNRVNNVFVDTFAFTELELQSGLPIPDTRFSPIDRVNFCDTNGMFTKIMMGSHWVNENKPGADHLTLFVKTRNMIEGNRHYLNILKVTLKGLHYKYTSFGKYKGTSMAAPHVAGAAALSYSYNTEFGYGYKDVKNAILKSGKDVAALSEKTTTGKALDAYETMIYINKVTGVVVNEIE